MNGFTIMMLFCVACDAARLYQTCKTEAAHVGRRGIAQKCSDLETIPLCAYHHRLGPDSQHRLGKAFWPTHGLDRAKLIQKLQEEYARA